MSKLREIQTNKADFSAFSFALKKSIAQNPNFNATQLNSMIAESLGARSYEAMPFHNAKPTNRISDSLYIIATNRGMAFGHENNQAIRIDSWDELMEMGELKLYSKSYSDEITQDLIKSKGVADFAGFTEPYSLKTLSDSINDELLDFCLDLDLSAEQLKEKYTNRTYNNSLLRDHPDPKYNRTLQSPSYPHVGLDRETYQQEAGEGNTQIGYWEWVASQLEQIIERCVNHR